MVSSRLYKVHNDYLLILEVKLHKLSKEFMINTKLNKQTKITITIIIT